MNFMPTSQPLLTLYNVQHNHIQLCQKKPICHTLFAKNLWFVYGDNGAGKSTLLKIIAGLMLPDTGYIHIDSPQSVTFGYLSAKYGLKDDATVHQYLRMSCETPFKRPEDMKNALSYFPCLASVDPSDLICTLSSGQKMALRFVGLSLAAKKIWILDEPTRFLDKDTEFLFWQMAQRHLLNGHGIIMATHTHHHTMVMDFPYVSSLYL